MFLRSSEAANANVQMPQLDRYRVPDRTRRRQRKSVGHTCSAAIVGRQAGDDWRTVWDAVERERQTLACNSPPGTEKLFRADIRITSSL